MQIAETYETPPSLFQHLQVFNNNKCHVQNDKRSQLLPRQRTLWCLMHHVPDATGKTMLITPNKTPPFGVSRGASIMPGDHQRHCMVIRCIALPPRLQPPKHTRAVAWWRHPRVTCQTLQDLPKHRSVFYSPVDITAVLSPVTHPAEQHAAVAHSTQACLSNTRRRDE